MMKSITIQAEVTVDRILKLEIPCDVPAGPVEVELTIRSGHPSAAAGQLEWSRLFGLGQEVWRGIDAEIYVRDLRADRELGK
jgi:hypothetical protein